MPDNPQLLRDVAQVARSYVFMRDYSVDESKQDPEFLKVIHKPGKQ
jgi:hypothetical protein